MGTATRDSSQGRPPGSADAPDRQATARYIALMSLELRGLALGAGLPFLAHLLAMVEDEARSTPPT